MIAQAKLLKLPEHELKFTLDPAAVSFSAIHNGQVLLVEQEALTADGRPSQSSNKGGTLCVGARCICRIEMHVVYWPIVLFSEANFQLTWPAWMHSSCAG